jgi:hypothetical protein
MDEDDDVVGKMEWNSEDDGRVDWLAQRRGRWIFARFYFTVMQILTSPYLSIPSNGYSQITFRPWDLPIIDGHSRLHAHLYPDEACLPYPRHNISRTRNVGAKVTTHATPKANSRFFPHRPARVWSR